MFLIAKKQNIIMNKIPEKKSLSGALQDRFKSNVNQFLKNQNQN